MKKLLNEVKTPLELLDYMDDKITYGFKGRDGIIYTNADECAFEEGVKTEWRLLPSEEILKNGYGHCFDQVEVERDWFLDKGFLVHTFYIMFCLEEENPFTTHTYLVYEKDDKFYLFEHSDSPNKGIEEFATLKDAIFHQMKNHLILNNRIQKLSKKEIESLHVYEYSKPPLGVDMYGFIDYILDNGKGMI